MSLAEHGVISRFARYSNIVKSPRVGWSVFAISLLLTAFAYLNVSSSIQDRAQERFSRDSAGIFRALETRLSLYEQALRGGAGLMSASNRVERSEWAAYVASLDLSQTLPGIETLGYAVPLPQSQSEIWVQRVRQNEVNDFSIYPSSGQGDLAVVYFVESMGQNTQALLGFNLYSTPELNHALTHAYKTGLPATTPVFKTPLGQVPAMREANRFITVYPIFKQTSQQEEISGLGEFEGWLFSVFRAQDVFSGLSSQNTSLSYKVFDGADPNSAGLVFESSGKRQEPMPVQPLTAHFTKEMNGRSWSVEFYPMQDGTSPLGEQWLPLFVLLAGLIIDLLLFYVVISLYFVNRFARDTEKSIQQKFALNEQALAMQARLVEATERESKLFFELAPEAFLVVDQSGVIVKANKAAHKLFDYPTDKLAGVDVDDLLPDAQKVRHKQLRDDYLKKPEARFMGASKMLKARRSDGQLIPITTNLVPVDLRGEIHIVAAIHDVSEQKLVEKTLADAKEKAETASRSKSEFVANMSHEIRTPLNAVLGAAQLLVQTDPNIKQKKYIQMIRSSGEALLGVINDILDFSKIEAGYMELTPVPFDIQEVLTRVALMMSVNAGEKNIELVIDIDPSINNHIIGDPLRLQQILINLVSNAIKFTDTGHVLLKLERNNETSEKDKQKWRISVEDTGIGMNAEQQSRLFKAFSQADSTITRRFGGSGLGLVISSKLVEMMGSHLCVQSELGQGSTFYFDWLVDTRFEAAPPIEFVDAHPRKVLVLENNTLSQRSISKIFQQWGWEVEFVENIENIQQAQLYQSCDFFLADVGYANGNLNTFSRALDLKAWPSNCAHILLVQNNQQAELHSDEAQSFHSVLVKPIVVNTLLTALDEARYLAHGTGLLKDSDNKKAQRSKFSDVCALVVEDNVLNQTIATDLLEDLGVQVELANNGEEAIAKLEKAKNAFDLVFMDIHMPIMDGVSATQHIRRNDFYQGPIIAMTAGVLQSEREEYLSVGMDDFVPKPIDRGNLFRAIAKALPGHTAELIKAGSQQTELSEKVPMPQEDELPAFNSQRLEGLARGKPRRIRGIIDALVALRDSGSRSLSNGAQAIKDRDFDRAHFEYHSLKGVVANYGGEQLAASLKQFESYLREMRSYEDLLAELEHLQDQFTQFVTQSGNWVDQQSEVLRELEKKDAGSNS